MKRLIQPTVYLVLLLFAVTVPLLMLPAFYNADGLFANGEDTAPLKKVISLVVPICITLLLLLLFVVAKAGLKTHMKQWLARGMIIFVMPFMLGTIIYILAENHLRTLGLTPGVPNAGFFIADDVYEYPAYISDSIGIIRLDPNGQEWADRNYTINHDGFRSNFEFSKQVVDSLKEQGQMVVATIGDSHTEGCWASEPELSFPDLLGSKAGIDVLNFGIGGTDPLQYLLVAQAYLPLLMPDHVIVIVCLDNDDMPFDRVPSPGIPLYYTTSAGWISAQKPLSAGGKPNELFPTAQNAYDFYLENYSLLGNDAGRLKKQAGKLVITTWMWKYLHPAHNEAPEHYQEDSLRGMPTYRCLKGITSLCDSIGIQYTITGIPRVGMIRDGAGVKEIRELNDHIFRDIEYHIPATIQYSDFANQDGYDDIHFNDSGHRKYADFLQELLQSSP